MRNFCLNLPKRQNNSLHIKKTVKKIKQHLRYELLLNLYIVVVVVFVVVKQVYSVMTKNQKHEQERSQVRAVCVEELLHCTRLGTVGYDKLTV